MLTLSAPASKTWAASSAVRMPPPTVKGTKSSRAVRRTVSSSVCAAFVGRGNVEQNNFVGSFASVAGSLSCRITGVNEVDELYTLDDSSCMHVETGDDALGDHFVSSAFHERKLRRIFRPVAPDFSGWNCTPITLLRFDG